MGDRSQHVVILVTTSDRDEAERIAEAAVTQKLAGSAQISALDTWYRWEGSVRQAAEHEVRLFTRAACFDAVAALVRTLHGYDVPQVIALPIVRGTPDFLRWIDETSDGVVAEKTVDSNGPA